MDIWLTMCCCVMKLGTESAGYCEKVMLVESSAGVDLISSVASPIEVTLTVLIYFVWNCVKYVLCYSEVNPTFFGVLDSDEGWRQDVFGLSIFSSYQHPLIIRYPAYLRLNTT